MNPKELSVSDYTYNLPDERIAKYPLEERDLSKLLIYKGGRIIEDIYRNIASHIPVGTLLVFNDTKVIPARLFFKNAHGTRIEIFCLEPAEDNRDMSLAMARQNSARWNCMIGRANKWKEKILQHKDETFSLTAEIVDRSKDAFVVEFKWLPAQMSFSEVLAKMGVMPIPPYLHRESDETDVERYQTVYARQEGSVAAPTAGLHFTESVLDKLKAAGVQSASVTLHVGAGTFKPVKSEKLGEHEMHGEWLEVNTGAIEILLNTIRVEGSVQKPVIAVGTTSLRTIESLYWLGVKIKSNPQLLPHELEVTQWEPYETITETPAAEALESLLNWAERNKMTKLFCKTSILIAPGYPLKITDALITNFHQPNSTLLLLVAAIVGNDWGKIYDYALTNNFRFLSYGDGSLLWAAK